MSYLLHKYNMLTINPNINLVSNIGYDFDGSNCAVSPQSDLALKFGNAPRFEITKIVHPDKVSVDKKFEKNNFKIRVLWDESWLSALYKFYGVRYGYPAWKTLLKKILLYLKILKYA